MSAATYDRILLTGATGFLGSHLAPVLKMQFPDSTLMAVSRKDYDLLDAGQVRRMLKETRPDLILHLAARVGGIVANAKYPAEFFYENLLLNTQVFHESRQAGVRKFMTFMGGCSYPAQAPSPIAEDRMWDGFPQPESAPYSVAKKVLLVQSESYRRQYGFNSVVLIPGNVYGEFDNFNAEQSHVIPALIRRFAEAKESGAPSVTCFGSGRPTRDFVYAADVARLIPWFIRNYDRSEPVNLSSGTRTSIRELSETIRDLVGYRGEIVWDTSRPDGQMDKIFCVDRLHALGLTCDTPLREGLRRTVGWFLRARKEGGVRL